MDMVLDDDASKRRPVTAAQWLAAKAATEGAPATRVQVAAMLGCDVSAVYARAAAEGWRTADYRLQKVKMAWARFIDVAFGNGEGAEELDGLLDGDVTAETEIAAPAVADAVATPVEDESDDPAQMLSRGTRFLSRRLSRLMRQAERGGQISKQEIDGLTAMARMMERWETLARERAKEEETNRDAQIAEALRKIDRRILKLARDEAERLVAAECRPDAGHRDQ